MHGAIYLVVKQGDAQATFSFINIQPGKKLIGINFLVWTLGILPQLLRWYLTKLSKGYRWNLKYSLCYFYSCAVILIPFQTSTEEYLLEVI
jgi:hypothetical protein